MLEQYTIKETLNRFLQVYTIYLLLYIYYYIYNEDKASYLLYMYFVGLWESKV